VLFAKCTVVEKIVDPALDVITREAEALNEKYYKHLRRLEFWKRIRRLEEEVSLKVDVGIWIGLLLRLYMLMMKSKSN
jgi:hypothetical protein